LLTSLYFKTTHLIPQYLPVDLNHPLTVSDFSLDFPITRFFLFMYSYQSEIYIRIQCNVYRQKSVVCTKERSTLNSRKLQDNVLKLQQLQQVNQEQYYSVLQITCRHEHENGVSQDGTTRRTTLSVTSTVSATSNNQTGTTANAAAIVLAYSTRTQTKICTPSLNNMHTIQ